MGALDHLSDMCSVTETKRTLQIRKRRPLQVKNITVFEPFCFRGIRREIISSSCSLPLNLLRLALIISSCLCCFRVDQTVDLKVKMDCDGCERRVKHAVSSIRGVTNVNVNRKQSRVTVTGHIEAKQVLERIKSTGKRAELWPYVPYNLVAYPYVAGAYDKKAPSGFVRNAAQAVPNPNATEEQYMSIFSDENPNACSVM